MEKIFHDNPNQKKSRVAILISNKVDFRMKHITNDKKASFKMIKGLINQKDIIVLNDLRPKTASKCIKQKLIELHGEINSHNYSERF